MKNQKTTTLSYTSQKHVLCFPKSASVSSEPRTAGRTMSQRFTARTLAGLPMAAHSSMLIRPLWAPPGHGSLAWVGARLAFARQVWPRGLRGHAKCNMGRGQRHRGPDRSSWGSGARVQVQGGRMEKVGRNSRGRDVCAGVRGGSGWKKGSEKGK